MKIELTDKEKQDIAQKQIIYNQYAIALGTLRRQYTATESELLEKIQQAEIDYLSLLKFVFQSKSEEDMKDWVFDTAEFVFKKQ